MALTGPDGEQLSHLGRRFGDPMVNRPKDDAQAMQGVAPVRPHRGRWVGPPAPGNPRQAPAATEDPNTQATPAVGQQETTGDQSEAALAKRRRLQRILVVDCLVEILNSHDLAEEKRRILVQALGVFGTLP